MNDEFGSWIWYCWKDKKPDDGEYIYVYWSDYPEYEVDIGKPEEFNVSLDENTYWCYVYIPDKPKIEEKLSLEYRIEKLEKANQFIFEHLQKRAYEINDKLKEAYDKKVSELLGDED